METHYNRLSANVKLWRNNSDIQSHPEGDRSVNLKQHLGQWYDLGHDSSSRWADAFLCPNEFVLVMRNQDNNEFAVFDFTPSEYKINGLIDLATFDKTKKVVYFPSFDRSNFKRKVTHLKLLHPRHQLREILNLVNDMKDFQSQTGNNSKERLGKRYAFLSGDYIERNRTSTTFMTLLREFLSEREITMMLTHQGIPGMYDDNNMFGLNTPSNFVNVCWKTNYLKTNWDQCENEFKDNYCNGAPEDDLKMTDPDTDYPDARWLKEHRCKKHAQRRHLTALCDWAVKTNFKGRIGDEPIEAYCGCERSAIVKHNKDYWRSMGNNHIRARDFEDWSNVPHLNSLMMTEDGNIGIDSSEVETSVPTACWPSCNAFKSKWVNEYRAGAQNLTDGFAQGDCTFKGCINTVINTGIMDIGESIEQQCNNTGMNVGEFGNKPKDPTLFFIIVSILLLITVIMVLFAVSFVNLS